MTTKRGPVERTSAETHLREVGVLHVRAREACAGKHGVLEDGALHESAARQREPANSNRSGSGSSATSFVGPCMPSIHRFPEVADGAGRYCLRWELHQHLNAGSKLLTPNPERSNFTPRSARRTLLGAAHVALLWCPCCLWLSKTSGCNFLSMPRISAQTFTIPCFPVSGNKDGLRLYGPSPQLHETGVRVAFTSTVRTPPLRNRTHLHGGTVEGNPVHHRVREVGAFPVRGLHREVPTKEMSIPGPKYGRAPRREENIKGKNRGGRRNFTYRTCDGT